MTTDDASGTTRRDTSRQDATGPDYDYSLAIEEAADRYAAAGHPRTHRSVQRYCANGHLDCRKVTTLLGDSYRVAPYSIARHIAQINEAISVSGDHYGRDTSRQDATFVAQQNQSEPVATTGDNGGDIARYVATGRDESQERSGDPPPIIEANAKYVEQLEKRIEEKDEVISLIRDELKVKNTQIADMSARAREGNILMDGLRNLVLQLQPGRRYQDDQAPSAPQQSERNDNCRSR
jgi:hypothetical protein